MAKTKQEIVKQGIEEYIREWEKIGGVYNSEKAPILAARKFNHAGKIFDVVLVRFNTHSKGGYIYSIITRERGTITGGYEIRHNEEKAARAEYMKVDSSYV